MLAQNTEHKALKHSSTQKYFIRHNKNGRYVSHSILQHTGNYFHHINRSIDFSDYTVRKYIQICHPVYS